MRGGKMTDLKVEFVSLVAAGANRRTFIAKSAAAGETPLQMRIVKSDEELREIWCAVYAPDDVDTHGNWIDDKRLIRNASHQFMRDYRQIDREHDFKPTENFPCGSFIVDKSMGMGFINAEGDEEPDGTWILGVKVENDADWEGVKSGEYNGISMAGWAMVDPDAKPPKAAKSVAVAKSTLSDNVRSYNWDNLGFALMDTIRAIKWDNTITDKHAAILDAIAELPSYVQKSKESPMNVGRMIAKALGFKGPEDVVASFTAEAEKITKGQAPTEAALQEEYGAHLKALEAFDKGADSKPALDAALTKAKAALPQPAPTDQVALLKAALAPLEAAVAAMDTRLETLEKATPPSDRGEVRNNQDEKDHPLL